jgi:hypothetical protein
MENRGRRWDIGFVPAGEKYKNTTQQDSRIYIVL